LSSAGGGAGVADGAGAGVAVAAGAGVAVEFAAGGDCASAEPTPNEIAAIGTSAIMAERKRRIEFIQYSPWHPNMAASNMALPFRVACPGRISRNIAIPNTQVRHSSHDRYVRYVMRRSGGHWPIPHHWPYKAGINRDIS
jgi:hypothetical protein